MIARPLTLTNQPWSRTCTPWCCERYLQLAGGRQRVAAALDRQAREAGETLDADEALELADSELHAMRRVRRARRPQRRERVVLDPYVLVSALISPD